MARSMLEERDTLVRPNYGMDSLPTPESRAEKE